MPTRRSDYHPKWELISHLVRHVRAKDHCEACGVENYAIIQRVGAKYRSATDQEISRYNELREQQKWTMWRTLKYVGLTKAILSVAHLDRNPKNNRFSNLMALCQRCHLCYDMPQHIRNRNYGRDHDREHQIKIDYGNPLTPNRA